METGAKGVRSLGARFGFRRALLAGSEGGCRPEMSSGRPNGTLVTVWLR